jgi:short-subunit dehydrogenase
LLKDEDFSTQIQTLVDTNIQGALNSFLPLISNFKKRKNGQIAIISSLTAFIPDIAGIYGATKTFVYHLGNILRLQLKPHNVNVSVW